MEAAKVHESRFLLAAVLTAAAFSGIFLGGFLITALKAGKEFPAAALLAMGSLFLLCLLFSWDLFRRKLLLYADHADYFPAFGRKRTFTYREIQIIRLRPLSQQYQLIGNDGKKLACFEMNMPGCMAALYYLEQKGIPFQLPRPKTGITRIGRRIENHLQEETAFIQSGWSQEKIARERKTVLILRRFLAVLCALSFFLPFSLKIMIGVNLFILFCHWGLYLWLYPKMTLDWQKDREDSKTRIPYPLIYSCFSLLILLIAGKNMNYELNDILLPTACIALVLLASYLITLLIKNRRERIGKFLLVTMAALILSFCAAPALCRTITMGTPTHETVLVINKKTYRSGTNTNYYFQVAQNGVIRQMNVSINLYDSVNEGEYVTLCARKSIFGFQYEILHKP